MYYAIRHVTRYRYSGPITESHMELRMQPRSEGAQRCWDFQLRSSPQGEVESYRDPNGNTVHFFDIPGRHSRLSIRADAQVEFTTPPPLPEALDRSAWEALDVSKLGNEHYEMLIPSVFAARTERLLGLRSELGIAREDDPLTTLRKLNRAIFDAFTYAPKTTRVDSPIDDALQSRQGVCQDFAHVMIALVREIGIPCRYVSGYLFSGAAYSDRSTPGATHAWIEAYLPRLGWVGFDPTNDLVVADRHIRVAIGRDYADVPPTRGVFTGDARSELSVDVKVEFSEAPILEDAPMSRQWVTAEVEEPSESLTIQQMQEQQ